MTPVDFSSCLPVDLPLASLVGRAWRPGPAGGPSVIAVRHGEVIDISAVTPTTADLLDRKDAVELARSAPGDSLGSVEALLANSIDGSRDPSRPFLLAPNDVQAIKACGVTFAVSLLERVLEEQANGDASKARELRAQLQSSIDIDLAHIRPGSPAALHLRDEMLARGTWSQYMEVGLGTDAEVFSKSQPMSALGFGAQVGLSPASQWNNPEPEIVLAINGHGQTVGASLGNDVNLRDIEGRSALLLGKAKDNNGSCAIGPFIRLFDAHFDIDSVRSAEVALEIAGEVDDFILHGMSNMREISRDPLDLVAQTCGAHHQYPDGFMLFLGTMFSPIQDRGAPGAGFTHKLGDRVSIHTPQLGRLINTVQLSTQIPPWTFGVRALYANLHGRNLMGARA